MSDWSDLSVPGGAGSEGRWDRELVVAGVRHAASRGMTLRAAVVAVAGEAAVSERTLWRWLAQVPPPSPELRGQWLCTAYPQGSLSEEQRAEVLAERRRQKLEADRLRRKAARRARYRLSPATATDAADPTLVYTSEDLAAGDGGQARVVSLLGLTTD